jgi:hypothetical protein
LAVAALLATVGQTQAQFSRLFGGPTPAKPASPTGENPNRLMEIQVELAWLGDPVTFPYYLEARLEGPKMVVRGCVPNPSVRGHAMQLARLNCSVAVVDAVQENPAAIVRENPVPPAQLYGAILASLAESFPQLQPYLHVDCSADGKVMVYGQAPTFEHKLAISQAMRRLNGCTAVLNRVQAGILPENSGTVNPAQNSAAAGNDTQKQKLVPNARGVMVPQRQPTTPDMADPANMAGQPTPPAPKPSRPFLGWLNGMSPTAKPSTPTVPAPPAPIYPATNQPQPTTDFNPSIAARPIQQMGYQTFDTATAIPQGFARYPETLIQVPAPDRQAYPLVNQAPATLAPAVISSSRPLTPTLAGTAMQTMRPGAAPAGNQPYETRGIVFVQEPSPKSAPVAMQPASVVVRPRSAGVQPAPAIIQASAISLQQVPTPIQPAPAVIQPMPAATQPVSPAMQAALQQRVVAACGSDIRTCNVQILPGNKLKVEVTVTQPDRMDRVARHIFEIPELSSAEIFFMP